MMMKNNNIVTTFDGSTALRGDCRYIKGKFYKKGEQCFLINNRWNRIDNGLICYDHYKNEWGKVSDYRDYRLDTVVDIRNGKMVIGEIRRVESKMGEVPPGELIPTLFIFAGNIPSSEVSDKERAFLKARRGGGKWVAPNYGDVVLSSETTIFRSLLFDNIIPKAIQRNVQFSKFATFMYRSTTGEHESPYRKWITMNNDSDNRIYYFGPEDAKNKNLFLYYLDFDEEEVVMPLIFSKRLYFFKEAFSKIKDIPFIEIDNPTRKDKNVFIEEIIMDKIHTPSLRSKYFPARMTDLLCKSTILDNETAALDSFNYNKIYDNFVVTYGAADNLQFFKKHYKHYNRFLVGIMDKVKGDTAMLDNLYKECPYSFGIEYETDGGKYIPYTKIPLTAGIIPFHLLEDNGLIPTRDGSIRGLEYVTIPLYIRNMVPAIVNHTQMLRQYCHINKYNSLHVHIGNVMTRTKENIIAYYKLAFMIQNEIYLLFPLTYRNTAIFKHRGYNNPLPPLGEEDMMKEEGSNSLLFSNKSVDIIFGAIYYYLSEGVVEFKGFSSENHPKDRSGIHKWQVSVRYHWFNIIPYIWGDRRTIEFRIHTPTLNANKIVYYLFLLKSFLIFAERNVKNIVNMKDRYFNDRMGNLEYIIREVNPPEVAEKLLKYFKWRGTISGGHDPEGDIEISSDMTGFPEELKIIDI